MDIEKMLQNCYSYDIHIYANNLFEAVRDIPYEINDARSPELLLLQGKGYCTSKHRLLKLLFARIGIQSKLCFVPFRFSQIYLPPELCNRGMADTPWYHVFLKANIGAKSIDIDASFPLSLHSFYHVNEDRDGRSSQQVTIGTYDREFLIDSEADEKNAKNMLTEGKLLDAEKELWIEKYNQRLRSVS